VVVRHGRKLIEHVVLQSQPVQHRFTKPPPAV
jgi:hypothetical protein